MTKILPRNDIDDKIDRENIKTVITFSRSWINDIKDRLWKIFKSLNRTSRYKKTTMSEI